MSLVLCKGLAALQGLTETAQALWYAHTASSAALQDQSFLKKRTTLEVLQPPCFVGDSCYQRIKPPQRQVCYRRLQGKSGLRLAKNSAPLGIIQPGFSFDMPLCDYLKWAISRNGFAFSDFGILQPSHQKLPKMMVERAGHYAAGAFSVHS